LFCFLLIIIIIFSPSTLLEFEPGAAIAGVYRAAGKEMIPFEALTLGTGQTFCVVVVSFLRVLATL
jgi:hypothetical protein